MFWNNRNRDPDPDNRSGLGRTATPGRTLDTALHSVAAATTCGRKQAERTPHFGNKAYGIYIGSNNNKVWGNFIGVADDG
jgi:hypothetical protein